MLPLAAARKTSVAATQKGPYLRRASVTPTHNRETGQLDAQVRVLLHRLHEPAAEGQAGQAQAVQHVRGVHVEEPLVRLQREEAPLGGGLAASTGRRQERLAGEVGWRDTTGGRRKLGRCSRRT